MTRTESQQQTALTRLVRNAADDVVAGWRATLGEEPLGGARELQRELLLTVVRGSCGHRPGGMQRLAARLGEREPELGDLVHQLAALRQVLHAVLAERLDTAAADVEHRVNTSIDRLVEACTKSTTERLTLAALVDPLTGLRNRRALDRDLPERLALAARGNRPLTVVLGDLDGLKTINDRDGHAAGDLALRSLGAAIHSALRAGDTAYRIGGDEFLLVLPDTTAEEAETVITRVRRTAPSFGWGAASAPDDATDGPALIDLADERLLGSRRNERGPHGVAAPTTTRPTSRRPRRALAAGALAVSAILGGGLAFAADGVISGARGPAGDVVGGPVTRAAENPGMEGPAGSIAMALTDATDPSDGGFAAEPLSTAGTAPTTTTTTARIISALIESAGVEASAPSIPLVDASIPVRDSGGVLPLEPAEAVEVLGELVVRPEVDSSARPAKPPRPSAKRGRN